LQAAAMLMDRPLIFRRTTCRICDGKSLVLVMSFGETPLANAFLRKDQLSEHEHRFPLELFMCKDCGHLQLLDVVDPEILFGNYVYVSSTSPSFVEHFRLYAEDMIGRYGLKPNSLVVEIGSNDGILLRHFKNSGMKVLGVDPAKNIAEKATASGIETLPAFFTVETAKKIRQERGQASLVAANNVFAHADDLHGILEGVKEVLASDGVFVFEVSYLLDVYEKTLFDMTYHEHVCYHSVIPLQILFQRHGMELIETIRVPTHGGSLRGIAQLKNGPHPERSSVEELVQKEQALKLDKPETFIQFAKNIDSLKAELRDLLNKLKREGKRIAGFGAPAKLTTLMHYFEIGADLIEFVVDDSPLKQNLFTPGYHIPVVPAAHMYQSKPDYVLILAWNFADNIIKAHKAFHDQGGRFIVPLPKLEIR
jgi:SAM-dependent methyltransferase